jgi:hypothetical protein
MMCGSTSGNAQWAAFKNRLTTATVKQEEDEDMTLETFGKLYKEYMAQLAKQEPSSWSEDARNWAESSNIITGDDSGNKMYKKPVTREELVTILFRNK